MCFNKNHTHGIAFPMSGQRNRRTSGQADIWRVERFASPTNLNTLDLMAAGIGRLWLWLWRWMWKWMWIWRWPPSQSCIFKQRTRARPYIQYLVFSIRQQQQHGAVRCRRFGFHYTSTSILVRVPRLMMVQLAHQGGSALPVL